MSFPPPGALGGQHFKTISVLSGTDLSTFEAKRDSTRRVTARSRDFSPDKTHSRSSSPRRVRTSCFFFLLNDNIILGSFDKTMSVGQIAQKKNV